MGFRLARSLRVQAVHGSAFPGPAVLGPAVLLLLVLGIAAGCGKSDDSGDGEDSAAAEARAYFTRTCTPCHGAAGRGDGVLAATLNPPPRDYSDAEWQATVTDEHLKQVILQGGAAFDLNPMMPANPALADKPEVLDQLVVLIRSFAR